MRASDKILVAALLALLLIAGVSLMLAARGPVQTDLDDTTPTGVVTNYLFAIQEGDYERAYGYLSPELPGYPKTLQDFIRHVNTEAYIFDRDQTTSLQVVWSRNVNDWAVAEVEESYFSRDIFFLNQRHESTFKLNLALVDGEWKISGGERFIAYCWTRTVCP